MTRKITGITCMVARIADATYGFVCVYPASSSSAPNDGSSALDERLSAGPIWLALSVLAVGGECRHARRRRRVAGLGRTLKFRRDAGGGSRPDEELPMHTLL
ncbi:MAG: hypothetical protein QOH52_67, partial [Pseudonocardiales bacterium]|nr:hypothetical protein [Pseudonocardiales bacterium]